MTRRPHVILIISDQHARAIMGCQGDPYIRSPHLDSLAEGAVRCTAAYAPSPLCVPSRMAMLCGRMPMDNGIHHNSQTLASHVPTIAHSMAAAGYRTVLCGRMHFVGPDQRHGYHHRLVGDHTRTSPALREMPMGLFDGSTGQDGRCLDHSGAGRSTVMAYDEAVTNAACQYLASHHSDEPLFLTVGYYGPHNPYVCDRERFAYYQRLLPLPDAQELSAWQEIDHPAMRAWRTARHLHDLDPVQLHTARAAYYGACETIDDHIGQVVTAAHTHGHGDNLLLIYLSDHGDLAGERGLFWKSCMYEGSVGVPWLLRWDGHLRPGTINDPVSLLDLAPTLAALVDAPQLPGASGRDLSPALHGGSLPPADVISTLSDHRCGPTAMIRRGPWKLILHHDHDTGELYQLDEDPGERINRWSDADCASIRDAMVTTVRQYWDPERVLAQARLAREQLALLRAADHAYPTPDGDDDWQGNLDELWLDRD